MCWKFFSIVFVHFFLKNLITIHTQTLLLFSSNISSSNCNIKKIWMVYHTFLHSSRILCSPCRSIIHTNMPRANCSKCWQVASGHNIQKIVNQYGGTNLSKSQILTTLRWKVRRQLPILRWSLSQFFFFFANVTQLCCFDRRAVKLANNWWNDSFVHTR